jgi:hypothetical protein
LLSFSPRLSLLKSLTYAPSTVGVFQTSIRTETRFATLEAATPRSRGKLHCEDDKKVMDFQIRTAVNEATTPEFVPPLFRRKSA